MFNDLLTTITTTPGFSRNVKESNSSVCVFEANWLIIVQPSGTAHAHKRQLVAEAWYVEWGLHSVISRFLLSSVYWIQIMALLAFSTIATGTGAALVLYYVGLITYRLYFHPLAKFPGSKLAAASLWYEFYYDVALRGKFMWKLQEMHKRYGESDFAVPK